MQEFRAKRDKKNPALLPQADGAHLGQAEGHLAVKIAKEGARTIPPREHGGNCDIKNLSRGSKTYMPVYVEGGKFSIGDLHFSQGDGEICNTFPSVPRNPFICCKSDGSFLRSY